MNKVVRKEGYIDLDIFMKENKCQNLLWQKEAGLHSMFCGSKVKYVFMHEKEMWIYKYEEFPYFCYAELVAEELFNARYSRRSCNKIMAKINELFL